MRFFIDENRFMPRPFFGITSGQIVRDPTVLNQVDTLVLADTAVPPDPSGAEVDRTAYFAAIQDWVKRGGNLVLTDEAVNGLADLGLVKKDDRSEERRVGKECRSRW